MQFAIKIGYEQKIRYFFQSLALQNIDFGPQIQLRSNFIWAHVLATEIIHLLMAESLEFSPVSLASSFPFNFLLAFPFPPLLFTPRNLSREASEPWLDSDSSTDVSLSIGRYGH